MSSEAVAPTRSTEIESFLNLMYGEEKGYVYCPTKNPESGYWQPHFFQWPQQRVAIITHLMDQTKSKDCYVAPALFKAPSDKKPAFKGTNHVWIEFDGNAPDSLPKGIPEPSLRIRSSVKGHEHWYWRLANFESDYRVVEQLSKQLTYTLDADKSGWDASQVLRPPGTIHHDSKRRVTLISSNNKSVALGDFKNLVEPPPVAVVDTNFDHLPDIQDVIAKYKWPEDATDLFKKSSQPVGSRSSAMTRLGFHCIEMGMSNEECYVILLNADDRWGKFKHRPPEDRAKRLVGIVTHCRSAKSVQVELSLSDTLSPIFSWDEFKSSKIEPPIWVFKDLIAEQGLGILAAYAGTGKSTVSLYMTFCAILRKPFLCWNFNTSAAKIRGAFISFEMQPSEVIGFLNEMEQGYSTEEFSYLRENFFILPEGSAVNLTKKDVQQEILDRLLSRDISWVVFDSLKTLTKMDDESIETFFEWVNKTLRKEHKMTVWIIHHTRKSPNAKSEKGPMTLDDVYGSMGITTHPTTVLGFQKRSIKGVLKVLSLKIRSAEEKNPFLIKRAPFHKFILTNGKADEEEENGESVREDGIEPDSALFGRPANSTDGSN